jgi:peptidyl-dipeptidase Dcp
MHPKPHGMKRITYVLSIFVAMIPLLSTAENPLMGPFNTPHHTPPFDKIKHEHYVPAIKEGIRQSLAEIDAIVANPAPPTFENTIEAMSFSGELLSGVSRIFFPLNSAETDEQLQAIAREVSPLMSDYSNDILFNEALFVRVKAVYDKRSSLALSSEQATLLENAYKRFSRNGANLDKETQGRLRNISRELSSLSLQFSEHVLAETNAYLLHITDEADLAGLPPSFVNASAQLARSRNLDGWAVSLQMPSYVPFIQYAENRKLREEIFMAYATRAASGNDNDNREILMRIANLRLERAKLLGYPTHAHFVLEERMAESPEKVNALLHQLLEAARPAADKELQEVQQLANEMGADFDIMPWDWSYYSEVLRKKRFDLDQELLKPYFQLENVTKGIFDLTNRLWGLTYVLNEDIPVYHPEVKAYEVYDEQQQFLAVLFLDFFPRAGKNPGAWMTSFRGQQKKDGHDQRPHISVVCNFTRPTDTDPSLLNFREVTTYLHEFGHALHGMFSDVTYPDLSGTSVFRDFVELPSMIMENWAVEREFLDMFAVHYQTGEKIPDEMIQKIIDARNFGAGYGILRQLSFGLNDMAWHSLTEPFNGDPAVFEREAMQPAMLLPMIDKAMASPAFSHIFAGGYAAGYYSYKWSEVLDADAYGLFRENGIFDKKTARSFRDEILSKGGSEHPMVLYKRFRGQEPSVDALLRRDGLLK